MGQRAHHLVFTEDALIFALVYMISSVTTVTTVTTRLPHSWILTFGLAQCSNYDKELYTMKSDHLRLISEIWDKIGPN